MPPLNGLVLAGGKSARMGRDKSQLHWHGKEQRYYMADLLQPFCTAVFISCRPDQCQSIHPHYKTIPDVYEGLGPYGAILSAFHYNPDCAWLVTACDLPLLNTATLSELVQQRNPKAMATTFESPFDGLPEPLITIWEPCSYPILLSSLSRGYQCPRKALINNEVTIVRPSDPDALKNVNTPQELSAVQQLLNKHER